jgi:hypothetical protein
MLLGLLVACTAAAQDYALKSASGSTNATVYFPGRQNNFKLTSLNVTSDDATGALYIASSAYAGIAIKAAASTTTNLVLAKCTLASNDVVLLQNSTGAVAVNTVWTNTLTTNKLITLRFPLNTNLAVGDVLRERGTTAYTVQTRAAADAVVYYLDSITGLANGDIVVLYKDGVPKANGTISATASNVHKFVSFRSPAAYPVTIGDTIYERTSTWTNLLAAVGPEATALHVRGTNGFADGDVIWIATGRGSNIVRAISVEPDSVSTTNLTLTAAVGVPLVAGDRVYKLSAQTYSVLWPVNVGDLGVMVDVSTGLAANDNLVIASTGAQQWEEFVNGTPATRTNRTITISDTFGSVVFQGDTLYEASQTALTTTFAASAVDQSVICNVATGATNGDTLFIFPATGGTFSGVVAVAPTDYRISTIAFTGALGQVMAVGDKAYTPNTATSFPIGAATVREQNASGLWFSPPWSPVRIMATGATNCSINAAIGVYQ